MVKITILTLECFARSKENKKANWKTDKIDVIFFLIRKSNENCNSE